MAYSAISNLQNGKFLQIYYSEGVRNQISKDYSDWEMVKMSKVSAPEGRQLNFTLQTSLGPSAISYRNPNKTNSAFPKGQQIASSEYSANYKELEATIELPYNLWFALQATKPARKYADLLQMELEGKMVALKRRMAADLYGDGTGVIGQIGAAAATYVASGKAEFQLDESDTARGHVGFFEFQDILILRDPDATTTAFVGTTATPTYWRVESRDRRNGKVVLQGLDANFDASTMSGITTQAASGAVFYRWQQEEIPDLTAITDYGTTSDVMAGLESLGANDGRTVHGIVMSGALASTKVDCGANAIDVSYIQQGMDDVKIAVGRGVYSWKKLMSAPEANAAFIESREGDRRFNSIEDAARGVKKFGYQHEGDFLEITTSEYVKKKRMWCLPEAKAGNKVLEYYGTDFEPVRAKDGDVFHFEPNSSGGYNRKMLSFLHSQSVLVCKHPASLVQIRNFTY